MSVQYNGYSRMPTNMYETFPFSELEQSKQLLKKYTSYAPRTTENNIFKYTGTEIKQNKHQTLFLQRSLIESSKISIFEYYGRIEHLEPWISSRLTGRRGSVSKKGVISFLAHQPEPAFFCLQNCNSFCINNKLEMLRRLESAAADATFC